MKAATIMMVAGDPSGDSHAAALARALRARAPEARLLGAGGPEMERAGVRLDFDLTKHAVIGLTDVIKKFGLFRRRMKELAALAAKEKPELIILVDFSGFNRRLARAIRAAGGGRPKIVQYVSPQVWASRPGRAEKMARDFDLLLCLFPFEKEWYARRTPSFRVEWVGHPMFDKHGARGTGGDEREPPLVLLLPGSRRQELRRHLPVLLGAAGLIERARPARFKLLTPTDGLARMAQDFQVAGMPKVEIQTGGLAEALAETTVALASTGTVTLECAYFGVPTVALYKTSLLTYEVGRRIVSVKYLAMPNILAGEALYPEFIQDAATPEAVAQAALDLLNDPERRRALRAKLGRVVASLGGPGASDRAAAAILNLL